MKLDAAFAPEHKHLFNEFGINLRKSQMFDRAIEDYQKALEVSQAEDDHLHVNLARSFFEKGDVKSAVAELKEAARINPELDEARKFWEHLRGKRLIGDPYPADKVAKPERAGRPKAEPVPGTAPESSQSQEALAHSPLPEAPAPQTQPRSGPRAGPQKVQPKEETEKGRLHVQKDKEKGLGRIIMLDT